MMLVVIGQHFLSYTTLRSILLDVVSSVALEVLQFLLLPMNNLNQIGTINFIYLVLQTDQCIPRFTYLSNKHRNKTLGYSESERV